MIFSINSTRLNFYLLAQIIDLLLHTRIKKKKKIFEDHFPSRKTTVTDIKKIGSRSREAHLKVCVYTLYKIIQENITALGKILRKMSRQVYNIHSTVLPQSRGTGPEWYPRWLFTKQNFSNSAALRFVPQNNLRRLNAKRGGEKRPLKPCCFPDITLPQITCFVQMSERERARARDRESEREKEIED